MKFEQLGLKEPLLKTLNNENYLDPTPVQEMVIPTILDGKDVLACAQTGTGKTAAFSLPIIQNMHNEYKGGEIPKLKLLILTPTRELAIQIRNNIRTYCIGTKLKCSVIFGGVNQSSQKEVLKKGVDIIVATPGRLLDLANQKIARLDNIKYLVLDEADTMLDMGFIVDIKKIVSKIPSERQTLLFSATMPDSILKLAESFQKNPKIVKVTPVASTVDKISQEVYYVDKNNKNSLLLEILKNSEIKSAIIFSKTKHGANRLEDILNDNKINCSVIHGNKSQNARVKALDDFKQGKTKILIATDIAARGIDINDLSHVINYDIPEQAETYVHRIGRTARAGKEGVAISLCSIDERKDFEAIEKLIKKQVVTNDKHDYPMQIFTLSPKKNKGGFRGEVTKKTNTFKKSNSERTNFKKDNRNFSQSSKGIKKVNYGRRGK